MRSPYLLYLNTLKGSPEELAHSPNRSAVFIAALPDPSLATCWDVITFMADVTGDVATMCVQHSPLDSYSHQVQHCQLLSTQHRSVAGDWPACVWHPASPHHTTQNRVEPSTGPPSCMQPGTLSVQRPSNLERTTTHSVGVYNQHPTAKPTTCAHEHLRHHYPTPMKCWCQGQRGVRKVKTEQQQSSSSFTEPAARMCIELCVMPDSTQEPLWVSTAGPPMCVCLSVALACMAVRSCNGNQVKARAICFG